MEFGDGLMEVDIGEEEDPIEVEVESSGRMVVVGCDPLLTRAPGFCGEDLLTLSEIPITRTSKVMKRQTELIITFLEK